MPYATTECKIVYKNGKIIVLLANHTMSDFRAGQCIRLDMDHDDMLPLPAAGRDMGDTRRGILVVSIITSSPGASIGVEALSVTKVVPFARASVKRKGLNPHHTVDAYPQ
jgi:hypothetical protein